MSNDGEQRQVKQVSPSPSETRRSLVLPAARRASASPAAPCRTPTSSTSCWSSSRCRLPPAALRAAAAQRALAGSCTRAAPARAGTVRSGSLGNAPRHARRLGYIKGGASAFERLSLAGRMLKEAARAPPAGDRPVRHRQGAPAPDADLEALSPPALPTRSSCRASGRRRAMSAGCRRSCCSAGTRVDTRFAAAVARGTNLARWLTALPPNMLDAARLPRAPSRAWRASIGLKLRWLDERALQARRRRRLPRGGAGQRQPRRRHRAPAVSAGAARTRRPAGRRARRQGHPL